jgi:hypothetical protein
MAFFFFCFGVRLEGEDRIATEISSASGCGCDSALGSGLGVPMVVSASSPCAGSGMHWAFLDVGVVFRVGLVTRADSELKERVDWLRVEAAPLPRVVGMMGRGFLTRVYVWRSVMRGRVLSVL